MLHLVMCMKYSREVCGEVFAKISDMPNNSNNICYKKKINSLTV